MEQNYSIFNMFLLLLCAKIEPYLRHKTMRYILEYFLQPIQISLKRWRVILVSILCSVFLVLLYNLLKAFKSPMIITMSDVGAETIPYLKILCILPASIFVAWSLHKLHYYISIKHMFLLIGIFYLIFFLWFSIIIKHIETYFLTLHIQLAKDHLPKSVFGTLLPLLSIIKIWPITIFYCLAELMSLSIYFYAFFGYLNSSVNLKFASIMYPMIHMTANMTGAGVPHIINICRYYYPNTYSRYCVYMYISMLLMILSIILFVYLTWLLESSPDLIDSQDNKNNQKEQESTIEQTPQSFLECILGMYKSNFISSLIITMICYQTITNIMETMWNIYALEFSKGDSGIIESMYANIISTIAILSSIISILLPWLMNKQLFVITAMSFPICIFVLLLSFCYVLIKHFLLKDSFHYSSNMLQLCGAIIILLRGFKYSIYDNMKELCLVLIKQQQLSIKIVLEAFASRVGKTTGSITIMLIYAISNCYCINILTFPTLLMGIIAQSVSGYWIYATKKVTNFYKNTAT